MKDNKINFYKDCIDNGYTNMLDEKQALKAKVIAMDLGLDFYDIVSLFNEAKTAYENFVTKGELIVEILLNDESLKVYERPNCTHYWIKSSDDEYFDGLPKLEIETQDMVCYEYHPGKDVYRSITTGGNTFGGVEHKSAYTTERIVKTNKGKIKVTEDDCSGTVMIIKLSPITIERFKHGVILWDEDGNIYCWNRSEEKNYKLNLRVAKEETNYSDMMNSWQLANLSILYDVSVLDPILGLINRIFNNNYPESDEEIYQKAIELGNEENSNSISEAIKQIKRVLNYKNSNEIYKQLEQKYVEVTYQELKRRTVGDNIRDLDNLIAEYDKISDYKDVTSIIQFLKEKRVILKEREAENKATQKAEQIKKTKKARKKILVILIIGIIISLIIYGIKTSIENRRVLAIYSEALSLIETGNYDEAIAKLSTIKNHEFANEKISETEKAIGIQYIQAGDYENAYGILKELDQRIEENEALTNFSESMIKVSDGGSYIASAIDYLEDLPDGIVNKGSIMKHFAYLPVDAVLDNGYGFYFSYDSIGKMQKVYEGNSSYNLTTDENGRILNGSTYYYSFTVNYNSNNEFESITHVTSDGSSSLVRPRGFSPDGTIQYSYLYDDENRIVETIAKNDSGSRSLTINYDWFYLEDNSIIDNNIMNMNLEIIKQEITE